MPLLRMYILPSEPPTAAMEFRSVGGAGSSTHLPENSCWPRSTATPKRRAGWLRTRATAWPAGTRRSSRGRAGAGGRRALPSRQLRSRRLGLSWCSSPGTVGLACWRGTPTRAVVTMIQRVARRLVTRAKDVRWPGGRRGGGNAMRPVGARPAGSPNRALQATARSRAWAAWPCGRARGEVGASSSARPRGARESARRGPWAARACSDRRCSGSGTRGQTSP